MFFVSGTTSRLLFFSVALFLFVVILGPVCFAVGVDEAGAVLDQAERDLSSAFVAVAEAGDSGADVAGLLERLSVAGDYLSGARVAYRVGDYERAYSDSIACSSSLDGVASDAMQLQAAVENERSEGMLFAVVGSGVGLVLLCILGLLGWRYLSKWYLRRAMDLKPVVEDRQ